MSVCSTPLSFGVLVDYWLDELPPATEAATEEHLLQCSDCGQRVEWVAEVAVGTRDLIRHGRVPLALTPALLARLELDGVRIRQHRVEAGGYTHCTAGPEDDLVSVTLRGEFRADERVDVVYLEAPDFLRERRTGVPVDGERREVTLAESGAAVRALPAQRLRLALYGVGPSGERTIGEYTLLHAPWPGVQA
jgi:hypothetical protein